MSDMWMFSSQLDVICPIACGRCCDLWRDVAALTAMAPADAMACPHYRDESGCVLPRKARPVECLEYLCDVAASALDGTITISEAQEYKKGVPHE